MKKALSISLMTLGLLFPASPAAALAVSVKCFPDLESAQSYKKKLIREDENNQAKEERLINHFVMPTVSVEELTVLYGPPNSSKKDGITTLGWGNKWYWSQRTPGEPYLESSEYCVKATEISRSLSLAIKINEFGEEISRTPVREISY